MTKEELAEKLNGMEYRHDIPKELLDKAKEHSLVIVTGHSDDLIEFEGAFRDEGDCYGGGAFYVGKEGILLKPDQDDFGDSEDEEDRFYADLKLYMEAKKNGRCIVAERCVAPGYSWSYVTSIPHATFDVLEDDEKQCRGIVFSIEDI